LNASHPLPAAALACLLAACAPTPDAPKAAPADAATPAPVTAAGDAGPAAATAPATAATARIPAAFLGEWNRNPADCGSSRNDSRLIIEPDRVSYWESSGPVTAVTVDSPTAVEVTLRLAGEGEVWIRTQRFELQGDTLTAIGYAGGQTVRQRCPPVSR
jgi:hypothetical protein